MFAHEETDLTMSLATTVSTPNPRPHRPWLSALKVAVVVIGALLTMGAWALASAPGSTPDEDFHLASIWCPTPIADHCTTKVIGGKVAVQVPEAVAKAALLTSFNGDTSAQGLLDLSDSTLVWTSPVDNGDYPGPFYDVMHWFVGPDVMRSIVAIRLFSGVVALVVIGAAVAALSPTARRLACYALLPSLVPMGLYLIVSVNPSGWSVAGVTAVALGLHGLLTADRRWRAILAGAAALAGAALTAISRQDAAAFCTIVAVALTILHWQRLRDLFRAQSPLQLLRLLVPVAIAIIGVLGFLSGTQMQSAVHKGSDQAPSLINQIFVDVQSLLSFSFAFSGYGAYGALGWLDTPMPDITVLAVLLVWFGLAWYGLRHWTWSKGIAFAGIAGTMLALPLVTLLIAGVYVGTYFQGRYLVPLVPVLLLVILSRSGQTDGCRPLNRWQTGAAIAALAVAQSFGLYTVIRRYIMGMDGNFYHLNIHIEWWWPFGPSPESTWLLGSLGFLLVTSWLWWARQPAEAALAAAGPAPTAPVATVSEPIGEEPHPIAEPAAAPEVESAPPTRPTHAADPLPEPEPAVETGLAPETAPTAPAGDTLDPEPPAGLGHDAARRLDPGTEPPADATVRLLPPKPPAEDRPVPAPVTAEPPAAAAPDTATPPATDPLAEFRTRIDQRIARVSQ